MARIGRMTNSITAIKPERLAQYAKDFNADRANLVAANAAVSSGVLEAATDYKGQRALPRDFSIELKQGSITNQRHSRTSTTRTAPRHEPLAPRLSTRASRATVHNWTATMTESPANKSNTASPPFRL